MERGLKRDPLPPERMEIIPAKKVAKSPSDHQLLLVILPEEIWRTVLSHVDTGTSYQSISNAAGLFKDLLEPKKVSLLLQNVLPILLPLKPGFRVSELLKLRRVSRDWKHSMDCLTRHPLLAQNFLEVFAQPVFRQFEHREEQLYDAEFMKNNVFARFEKHYDPTHLNTPASPFLSRKIVVTIPRRCVNMFFQAFVGMLEKYGQHVWKCTVESTPESCSPRVFFSSLENILKLMPNLKSLSVDCEHGMANTKDVIVTETLPTLRSLRSIRLRNVPGHVVNRIITANSQITNAEIEGSTPLEYLGPYLEFLSNLSDMSIEINTQEELIIFTNAKISCCPTKLQLTMQASAVSGEKLFRAVETQFGETLTELHLVINNSYKLKYETELLLPKVKDLTLEMDFPAPLDFLLPMNQSVERLMIEIMLDVYSNDNDFREARERERKGGDKIKIYRYWRNRLHVSRVWVQFPKLMCLEVKCEGLEEGISYTCHRQQWEEYKAARASESSSDEREFEYPARQYKPWFENEM